MIEVPECPSCGAQVRVGKNPKVGQLVKCTNCASELEVIWLEPVEVDWPYDVDDASLDDDYDDSDDDY